MPSVPLDGYQRHEPGAGSRICGEARAWGLDPADGGELPLRTGRAIGWIEDALKPLRGQLPDADLRRLVLAIRATMGIEAHVWLTDVAGLSREDSVGLMRSSARTLLREALPAQASPDPPAANRPSRGSTSRG